MTTHASRVASRSQKIANTASKAKEGEAGERSSREQDFQEHVLLVAGVGVRSLR